MKINRSHVVKILELVDHGLVKGKGIPEPGKMCVEAAVCFALGEPHGDEPSCVGSAVRNFKIRLNDANWSSAQARAKGLRAISIAQLRSDEIDQKAFSTGVVIKTVQRVLPIALRAAARMVPNHAVALEAAAVGCEAVIDLAGATQASRKATDVAAAAYAAYAAAAAAYAAYATDVAAYAAAAAYAADAADAAYAAYAAYAADAADAAAYAAYVGKRGEILTKSAQLAVEVLIELKCKGTKWLDLVEEGK